MIGGGSGRTAGAVTTRGASACARRLPACGRPPAARGASSPLPRRRSIAARARSLASRRSSGATAVSTGGAGTVATVRGRRRGPERQQLGRRAFSRGAAADGAVRQAVLAVSAGFSVAFSAGFSTTRPSRRRVLFAAMAFFGDALGLDDRRRAFGDGRSAVRLSAPLALSRRPCRSWRRPWPRRLARTWLRPCLRLGGHDAAATGASAAGLVTM